MRLTKRQTAIGSLSSLVPRPTPFFQFFRFALTIIHRCGRPAKNLRFSPRRSSKLLHPYSYVVLCKGNHIRGTKFPQFLGPLESKLKMSVTHLRLVPRPHGTRLEPSEKGGVPPYLALFRTFMKDDRVGFFDSGMLE